ncbi:MAG: NERD domain-containing protein [Candidatus Accumulibacter propinquus]
MSELSRNANRCLQHYLDVFTSHQQLSNKSQALDEALHHFLDQRPAGKNLSSLDRATGLAAAPFWREADVVNASELSALAMSRILRHEGAISIELLEHLSHAVPDTLRWAIRYSKLFTRTDSQLWKLLRDRVQGDEWRTFIGVCDRLLAQLQPFDQLIQRAQEKLAYLSLLETLSYLSVLAYERLIPEAPDDPAGNHWRVYSRVISDKLTTCSEKDFNLNEERLAQSLKHHLSPIIFPSPAITLECADNLEAFTILIMATKERMDYEDSIDWFCYDPECRYRLEPGKSVIYNETENGSRTWQRTEQKSQALWHYWMNRGINEFIERGMAEVQIGSQENHERNALAYIMAVRGELQLHEIYGLDEEIELAGGGHARIFQTLLASELHSSFFRSAYVQPFQKYYAELGIVSKALSKLAFSGLLNGENRFPMTWAEEDQKIKRTTGWTVCSKYPQGSNLAAKAILDFWTSDLKALSNSLKEQPQFLVPTLCERPFYKIGRYNFQFPWVVAQQNNLTAVVNNLRRIGARRSGQMSETRRIELRLADQLRQRGFAVEVGYQPERTEQEDPGEVDLICYRDGLAMLLEIKSGYIRTNSHEIWLHRTNTLRKAAWQLRRKSSAVVAALTRDELLREKLGCSDPNPGDHLQTWIVDTSIELDQQWVDGFLVVSLESLQVILRDERELLLDVNQEPQGVTDTMFPDGFSAARFVEVVESGEVWKHLA